jgi:DNA-binding MarR family transcriptional regulator
MLPKFPKQNVEVSLFFFSKFLELSPTIKIIDAMTLLFAQNNPQGITNKDIADTFKVPVSTATRLINKWYGVELPHLFGSVVVDLLQETISKDDKRRRVITLTTQGIHALAEIHISSQAEFNYEIPVYAPAKKTRFSL